MIVAKIGLIVALVGLTVWLIVWEVHRDELRRTRRAIDTLMASSPEWQRAVAELMLAERRIGQAVLAIVPTFTAAAIEIGRFGRELEAATRPRRRRRALDIMLRRGAPYR